MQGLRNPKMSFWIKLRKSAFFTFCSWNSQFYTSLSSSQRIELYCWLSLQSFFFVQKKPSRMRVCVCACGLNIFDAWNKSFAQDNILTIKNVTLKINRDGFLQFSHTPTGFPSLLNNRLARHPLLNRNSTSNQSLGRILALL